MQLIVDPIVWVWRRLFARVIEVVGALVSVLMRLNPAWWPRRYGIRVHRGLVYETHDGKPVLLDVYCPKDTETAKPVVLYIHGGGFGLFSRTSHWLVGVRFAAAGFVVCNIDYRLAPKNPYPAAHEDACDAYVWILKHISEYGGDPSRVMVAGESAGANLAMAVVLASSFRGEEPWAQRVFDAPYQPCVGVSVSGFLQVSDPHRFFRLGIPAWVRSRICAVSQNYLQGRRPALARWADPLLILASDAVPDRPLPPMFVGSGACDPIRDDTLRLEGTLRVRAVKHRTVFYPGEGHVFFMLPWRAQSRRCWADLLSYVQTHL